MTKWLLHLATAMLITGYLIHSFNFFMMNIDKMGYAMILFAFAMYFLFV